MLVKKDGTDGTIGSEHGEISPDKDGVYEVPVDLGEVLVRVHGFEEVIPEEAKAAKAAEPSKDAPAKPETAAQKKKREAEEAKAAKAAEDAANSDDSDDGSDPDGEQDEKSGDGDSQE